MNTYKRHRFPPDIISYAVWLYYRFNLSYRDIEDLLAERGITVTRESIRLWCIKFGAIYSRRLKRKHQGYGDTFYIDEVFIKTIEPVSLFQELKQRKVFRVAAVYVVLAWGILQVVDVVSEPLSLPLWFSTVTILLLAIGFPIALVFSWIFDFGPDGPTRTVTDTNTTTGVRSGFEVVLLFVLITGIGWLIFRDISNGSQETWQSNGAPVVVLMDTYAPRGVYDDETRRKSGTNADVLSDVLADLPVITQKETIGSTWDREAQILKQHPSLLLIHRSAFFHSMNQDLGVGYPEGTDDYSEEFLRLYQIADNKLVALLGFLAGEGSQMRFLVYSRGTGGGWADPDYRAQWIHQAEGRFPELANKITAIAVPGGTAEGSFKRQDAVEVIRGYVQETLRLKIGNDHQATELTDTPSDSSL